MYVEDLTAEQCRQWADELQAELHGHYGSVSKSRRQQAESDLEDVYERWKSL